MTELTREYLDKQFEKVATKEDIGKLVTKEDALKFITKDYLTEFTNKVVIPRVEEIIDEKTKTYKDEILTSNDRLAVKLDKILAEQQAITKGYKRMQERLNYLEAVVKVLAEKEGLKFQPPEV